MASKRRSRLLPWVIFGFSILLAVGLVLAIIIMDTGVEYKSVQRIPSIPPAAQTTVPPAAQPSAEPAPPPFVEQAMPTHLTIGRVGEPLLLDSQVDDRPARLQRSGLVLPPGSLPAVQDDPSLPWAGKPGTDATLPTVFACHAEADIDLPCNVLTTIDSASNESSGYQAVATLPGGKLVAPLVKVRFVKKYSGAEAWKFIMEAGPDRWFVVICDLQADQATGQPDNTAYNRVLEFAPVSSKS